MAKNVASHVLALAQGSESELKAYKTAVHHLDDVEKHTGKNGDISAIYGIIRKESRLPFGK